MRRYGLYIYERKDWPDFRWRQEELGGVLSKVHSHQGWLLGRMAGMGFDFSLKESLRNLTEEIVESNKIEGEILDYAEVRSSIARRFGIEEGGMTKSSRHIDDIVDMMIDATQHYQEPLTKERLFGWHAMLFPAGYSSGFKITVADWRTDEEGPMQVVSNNLTNPKVYFEAPAAPLVEREMEQFLAWFNSPVSEHEDAILRAAVAHFWFVTIHPFDDGNGRIARAIADMQMARADDTSFRFYSMSSQIHEERKEYYRVLEETQKGTLDITDWLQWFLSCLDRAIERSVTLQESVLIKARSWDVYNKYPVNERQRKVINLLLDGFEGKLTSAKYATITKISQDTALRDLRQLEEWGLVSQDGMARSTSFNLVTFHNENDELKRTVLMPKLHIRDRKGVRRL